MNGRSPRSLRWIGGLLVLYLGYPLAAFFVRVATGSDEGWAAPGLWSALWISMASATLSLLIGILTGVPLAYVLARRRGPLSAAIGVLVQLPLAVPPLITGIILIYIVGPYSFLGQLSGERLTETIWGLVIAQSFVSIPFLVVVARSAFRSVDPALDDVAATLGHGPLARFFRVDVPAASDGLRAGMILLWLRAFGEYGTVVILAYHPYSLPVYVDNLFSSAPLSQAEAPAVLAFAVAALAIALSTVRRLPTLRPPPELPAGLPPSPTTPKPVGFDIRTAAGTFELTVTHRESVSRLAIVGPSGAGKSLTLRALAGLLGSTAGSVTFEGVDITRVSPEARRFGYVPQGLGLLPGRTVWQQVMFGVDADAARAVFWLETLHLHGLHDRYPEQLSGGQRQRVCLARALTPEPKLVLLDEPFSALDAPVRHELRHELRSLQRNAGLSTVLVTHDAREAAMLADEVLVLSAGRVLQAGSVREIYQRPCSEQVAQLLGVRNFGHGRVGSDGLTVMCGGVPLRCAEPLPPDTRALWTVPPEQVRVLPVTTHPIEDGRSHHAILSDIIDLGTTVEMTVLIDNELALTALTADPTVTTPGDECLVHLDPSALSVWRQPDHVTAPAGTPGPAGQHDPTP